MDVQIDLFNQRRETIDYLSPHCAFFTYGENLGNADCLPVPESGAVPFPSHPSTGDHGLLGKPRPGGGQQGFHGDRQLAASLAAGGV